VRSAEGAPSAAPRVQTNFLYPENPEAYELSGTDTELTALRVRTASGVKAVLVNFGCHPVTGGPDPSRALYRVSADYPFYFRRTIAEAWACPVLFTLGAAGDAVPLNRGGDCRRQIGTVLGNSVLLGERLFAASSRGSAGDVELKSHTLSLEVRTIIATRGTDAPSAYEAARRRLLRLQDSRSALPPGTDPAGTDAETAEATAAYRPALIRAYRARLYPEDRFTVQVQFLRVGGVVLVCLPFEVLSEFAVRMKERFPHAVLVSIANGYEGYLPLAYEYERGGYEATADSTHFEIGTTDRLLEKVLAFLERF
jgi:hypothetical protein